MKKNYRRFIIGITSAVMVTVITTTVYAGQWVQNNSTWKYKEDNGAYAANGWFWIDGKSYCFDADGQVYMNTTTPDGFTVDVNGAWVVNGVIQTQSGNETTVAADEQYPLKGYIDYGKYFDTDPDTGELIWLWDDIHIKYDRTDIINAISEDRRDFAAINGYGIIRAIEEKDINYTHRFPIGIVAVFDELADLPGSNHSAENPKTQELAKEIRTFLNSFDWKHATDLEKAVRICNWVQQADYEYNPDFDSESYGSYGCLVEKKAVCQGYTEAAQLLGFCVGLPVHQLGTINHTWPVFYVDGAWLANDPTTKDQYFSIANVYMFSISYRMNQISEAPVPEETAELYKYQGLGTYCNGVGYKIPESILDVYPNARRYGLSIQGRDDLGILFTEALRLVGAKR